MPLAKVTWIYSGPARSWTESLYIPSEVFSQGEAANNLDVVLDYATDPTKLMGKRRLLLGSEYGILICRAGFPELDVRAKLRSVYQSGNQQHGADDAEISLVTRCGNQSNSRLKYISMRGLWANIQLGPTGFIGPNAATWQSSYSNYLTELITGGWGWWGKDEGAAVLIDDIVADANNRQVITLKAPLATLTVGSKQSVRVSGVNVKSRLNTQLVVIVEDNTTIRTVYPYATFPYSGGGQVRANTNTFIDIANAKEQRIGSRDVGNSWRPSVGRRPAVPRG